MLRKYFSKYILPHIKSFPSYKLSVTDRRQIEENVKAVVNAKSIYNALDIPDIRKYKEILTKEELVSLIIKKNESFINDTIKRDGGSFCIYHTSLKYNIVTFQFNELPVINNDFENIAVFLLNEDLSKVYFCGFYSKKDLKDKTYCENNKTYLLKLNDKNN